MIRFFKSTQPAMMIIIPIIILAFWIRAILHPMPVLDIDGLPMWNEISVFIKILPSWLNFIILFILLSTEAIYFNLMLNKHEVLYKSTYMPALIFAFFISCSPSFMQIHPIHLVNLLLIRIFDRSFSLFKNEFPLPALFDSGFLSGIAALIFFPSIVMLPLLMILLVIVRPFRLKEWLIMLVGFFLPFFFLSTYLFCYHSFIQFWQLYINQFGDIHPRFIIEKSAPFTILVLYIGLLLLLALLKLRSNYRKNIIRTRSFQRIIFIFLILAGGALFLLKEIKTIDFLFLILPVTIFCSYFFISARKQLWLYEYGMWGLIALIIWNHFSP